MRPQPVTPVGTPPQGTPAHASPKAAPKEQADTVELSDQARARFLDWQEERREEPRTAPLPEAREVRQLRSAEDPAASSPTGQPAAPSPPPFTQNNSAETDAEPAKLYRKPEPVGSDLAKSLRLTGYSVSMIATKMNLDVETVKKYLEMI